MSIDYNDVLKRNREFAKLTMLSSMLIEIQVFLKAKEDTLLETLYTQPLNQWKQIVLTGDIIEEIKFLSNLRNFLSEIKRKYNTIPGCTLKIENEKIKELEDETKEVLKSIKIFSDKYC